MRALVCLSLLGLAAAAEAQDELAVVSLDYFKLDPLSGESRHEVLPMAIFDGLRFWPAWEWNGSLRVASTRRPSLLRRYPSVQVLHRGLRVGTVQVRDVYEQAFRCSGLIVGSGPYAPDTVLPASEITGTSRETVDGRRAELQTQTFIAVSGAVDAFSQTGNPLVTPVTDPPALERFARDVAGVAPREDLGPLGDDETRAYRLERHAAVVIVRKRRRAEPIAGPAGTELPAPLLTDIVVVRTDRPERLVEPLFISTGGTDAFGKGPQDYFIDAFELGDDTAYLAFYRRNYEVYHLRLFALAPSAATRMVFEGELYGC